MVDGELGVGERRSEFDERRDLVGQDTHARTDPTFDTSRHECPADIAGEPGSRRPNREQSQPVDPCIGEGVEGGDRVGPERIDGTDERHAGARIRQEVGAVVAVGGNRLDEHGSFDAGRVYPLEYGIGSRVDPLPPGTARCKMGLHLHRRDVDDVEMCVDHVSSRRRTRRAHTTQKRMPNSPCERRASGSTDVRTQRASRGPRRWSPRSHQRPQVGR